MKEIYIRRGNIPINLTRGYAMLMLNKSSLNPWIIKSLRSFSLSTLIMLTIFSVISYLKPSYVSFYSLYYSTTTSSYHSYFILRLLVIIRIIKKSFHCLAFTHVLVFVSTISFLLHHNISILLFQYIILQ